MTPRPRARIEWRRRRSSRREVEHLLRVAAGRPVPASARLGVGPSWREAGGDDVMTVPSRRDLRRLLRVASTNPVPELDVSSLWAGLFDLRENLLGRAHDDLRAIAA